MNLDSLGYGSPRFLAREVSLAAIPIRYPGELISLARSVAVNQGLEHSEPLEVPVFSDGIAFLMRGDQGVTIYASKGGLLAPNYHQMTDTADRVDFNVADRSINFAWGVLRSLVG